jgi:inosine-uridine nucleoside N-ribohydrolase
VIENRPGAGSAIGTEAASRAEPNGNTLLIASPAIVINSQLRKLNYNPLTSFEPICLLVNIPNLIAVNSASPYHTLADLFDAARAKPGELTLAAVGPATSSHIATCCARGSNWSVSSPATCCGSKRHSKTPTSNWTHREEGVSAEIPVELVLLWSANIVAGKTTAHAVAVGESTDIACRGQLRPAAIA